MDQRHEVGQRLRALRMRRRLSLNDVQRETGLHYSTVGKYERGERQPSLDTLRELAELYGATVTEIVGEVPDRSVEEDSVRELLAASQRLTDEQRRLLAAFLRALSE